jgi:hypothetical protein
MRRLQRAAGNSPDISHTSHPNRNTPPKPPSFPQPTPHTQTGGAPTPRRHGMLRPLRLDFCNLDPAPLTDPHPSAPPSIGAGLFAGGLSGPPALPPRSGSAGTSPADWINRVEAQLSTRARSRSSAGDGWGASASGGAPAAPFAHHAPADTTAANNTAEELELVPPAFVLLGRIS